jgi:Cu+-exporting ATPase
MAASLENNSEHLIGKAILSYAEEKNIPTGECRDVSAIPGRGITGEVKIDGQWKKVIVGNRKLLSESGFDVNLGLSDSAAEGTGTLFVVCGGVFHGVIHISDTLRPDAISTVATLAEKNIQVGILSGDSQAIVDSLASQLHPRFSFGELLPNEKVDKLRKLRSEGKIVMMVGDGINDAPALSTADVGVALGSATDLTKENADVTIIGTQLAKIPWLLRLGEKTYRIIQWNLFWAFIYNIAGIVLAALGFLDPIIAACAMIASSVFIIINSRRLKAGR